MHLCRSNSPFQNAYHYINLNSHLCLTVGSYEIVFPIVFDAALSPWAIPRSRSAIYGFKTFYFAVKPSEKKKKKFAHGDTKVPHIERMFTAVLHSPRKNYTKLFFMPQKV